MFIRSVIRDGADGTVAASSCTPIKRCNAKTSASIGEVQLPTGANDGHAAAAPLPPLLLPVTVIKGNWAKLHPLALTTACALSITLFERGVDLTLSGFVPLKDADGNINWELAAPPPGVEGAEPPTLRSLLPAAAPTARRARYRCTRCGHDSQRTTYTRVHPHIDSC
jgi:hypothetical protein